MAKKSNIPVIALTDENSEQTAPVVYIVADNNVYTSLTDLMDDFGVDGEIIVSKYNFAGRVRIVDKRTN